MSSPQLLVAGHTAKRLQNTKGDAMTSIQEEILSIEKYIEKLRTKLPPSGSSGTTTISGNSYMLNVSNTNYWYNTNGNKEAQQDNSLPSSTTVSRNLKALVLFIKKLHHKCATNLKMAQKVFEAMDLLFETDPSTLIYGIPSSVVKLSKNPNEVQTIRTCKIYSLLRERSNTNENNESVWYLFYTIVSICKEHDKMNRETDSKSDKYVEVLLNKFCYDWLRIGIDYFGVYFQEIFNKQLTRSIDFIYDSIIQDIINYEGSSTGQPTRNDEEDENEMHQEDEDGVNIDLLVDYLHELVVYLSVSIKLNLDNDLVFQKTVRLVFYIFEELDKQSVSTKELINLECIFVKTLTEYATQDKICVVNNDKIIFTLTIFETIISRSANNYTPAEALEASSSSEIKNGKDCRLDDVLASALHDLTQYTNEKNCQFLFDINYLLNLEKWFEIYEYPKLPFSVMLNEELHDINSKSKFAIASEEQESDGSSNSSTIFKSYIGDELSDLNINSVNTDSVDLFDAVITPRLLNLMKLPSLDSSQLVNCLRLLGKLDCEITLDNICLKCDVSEHQWHLQTVIHPREDWKASKSYNLLQNYVLNKDLTKISNSVRFELLKCFKRIFNHFSTLNSSIHLNSVFFNFVAQCFDSEILKIRTLAARILVLYFIDGTDETKMTLFKFLEEKHPHYTVDTRLETWTHFTLASKEDFLDLLLLKLVNFVQSPVFFEECMSIAQINYVASLVDKQNAYQLLTPVLPVIVRNQAIRLSKSPGIFKKLAKLTNRPLDSFLTRFQRYIIPSNIVIYYQKDIIQQISDITKIPKHTLIESNITKIIAYLLVKEKFFSQEKIITIISNCDSSYKNKNFQTCFDIYQTLSEICQQYDNPDLQIGLESEGVSNKLDVLKSLYFVFNLVQGNSTNEKRIKQSDLNFQKVVQVTDYKDWVATHKKTFEAHFTRHILGIFHYFNRSMCDDVTMITYFDKLQIINGITFAIEFSAETSLASCLPQISMCLQVGMEIVETRYNSLKAWYYLIKTLSISQLLATIDIPLSFIQQKWRFLDQRSRNLAYLIFDTLIKDSSCLYKKPSIIYSLMKNEEINLIEKHKLFFKNNNAYINSLDCLSIFTTILKNYKNRYVVSQTLLDIEKVLQNGFKDITKFKTHSVQDLLGTLLQVSYNFKNTEFCISLKATECISYIGAIDPTVYKINSHNDNTTNRVYDLNIYPQQRAFMKHTINDVLVPAFWQATNPFQQSFIAFAIQEYLIGCEFDSKSSNFESEPEKKNDWENSFNELSKVTLEPLRSSKYNISTVFTDYKSIVYPCYNKTLRYQQWINIFTSDLLKSIVKIDSRKASDSARSNSFDIFRIYCSLMKASNVKFCEYILPYAIAHILSALDDDYADLKLGILAEILTIFKTEISLLNRHQVDTLKMCYESIFKILEYLKKLVSQHGQKSPALSYLKKTQVMGIEKLILDIPLDLMAKRSLEINSFERAVLYLDQCYRSNSLNTISLDLLRTYLQTAYANIQDTDAIDGVLKTFTTIDLSTKLDELLYSDNWEMAHVCLDELGTFENNDSMNLKCFESMNTHQLYKESLIKLHKLEDSIVLRKNKADTYLNFALESSVMEGDITTIKNWVAITENKMKSNVNPKLLFNYNLNKALLAVSESDYLSAQSFLQSSYAVVVHSFITSPSATTVLKIKEILTKLHYLFDLRTLTTVDNLGSAAIFKVLNRRLKNVGASFSSRYEIMTLKKCFTQHFPAFKDSLFDIYFEMAQLSRKSERVDLASSLLMDSWAQPQRNDFQLELEYSDLLWEKGEKEKALTMVGEIYDQMRSQESNVVNHQEAVVLLKYAKWSDYSNNSTPTEIITKYRKVCELDAAWEESFFQLGIFYSKYLEKKVADKNDTTNYALKKESMKYLLHSLKINPVHVREALPKVITYWLDTADLLKKSRDPALKSVVKEMCSIIDRAMAECPVYIWYTVLLQFVSRILHSHLESAKRIQKIIVLLALNYPQYILWYIASMINSSESSMTFCGKTILKRYRASGGSSDFASSALNLVMNFSKICSTPAPTDSNNKPKIDVSLKKDFAVDMSIAPTGIAVPVQANFGVSLPLLSTEKEDIKSSKIVSISQMGAYYVVFASLRKPKKIQLYGSDGKCYEIMCKMEDVRQDDQYMQFAQNVSFLLSTDSESKKRNLSISTYFILSLNESYGIIELVPNVMTIRNMLLKLYQAKGVYEEIRHFHQAWDRVKSDDVKCLELYYRFKAIFKPVLHEWFLNSFPDPIVWYNATNTFSRSYAVMCMVGHILGLGDRHCDNILIDVRSGHVLHVDYDILFEKGQDLPVPEKVPFRLTQNIVDALGITGLEGTFRRACEVSLKVIRNNELTLLNIIEIMMYGRGKSLEEISLKTKEKHFIGRENQSISEVLRVIRNKMKGIDPSDFVAISVPAQVESLLQEATNEQTLSKMYMGWLAIW